MRKQYHFWPSERGLLAWDIHRLIELSQDLPHRRIAVSQISEIDEVYWFDGDYQHPTCRNVIEHIRLIQEVDPAFPIPSSARST